MARSVTFIRHVTGTVTSILWLRSDLLFWSLGRRRLRLRRLLGAWGFCRRDLEGSGYPSRRHHALLCGPARILCGPVGLRVDCLVVLFTARLCTTLVAAIGRAICEVNLLASLLSLTSLLHHLPLCLLHCNIKGIVLLCPPALSAVRGSCAWVWRRLLRMPLRSPSPLHGGLKR